MSITLTKEILEQYHNDYFVETGTFHGGAVQLAIEAGFSDIRSIEIDPVLFAECAEMFQDDERVTIYEGDSLMHLPDILEDIDEPITFWLDAHAGNSPTVGPVPLPLLEEIKRIGEHRRKDHTILVDDVRLMGHGWDFSAQDVEKAILSINTRYEISYINSRSYERDILVAIVSND